MAVAASHPVVKMWTLHELDHAIQSETEEPVMMPFLTQALDEIMGDMYTGDESVMVPIPSPTGSLSWTLAEMRAAESDPNTNPAYKSDIQDTIRKMEETGEESERVMVAAKDISMWKITELKEAIKNPNTKPELMPYIKKALADLGEKKQDYTYMVTPVGLIPPKSK